MSDLKAPAADVLEKSPIDIDREFIAESMKMLGVDPKAARAPYEGALRSTFGTQLDESCLKQARRSGRSDKEIIANFDKYLASAMRDFVPKCAQDYPETKRYVQEWMKSMRDTVIICDDGFKKESPKVIMMTPFSMKDLEEMSVNPRIIERLGKSIPKGKTFNEAGSPMFVAGGFFPEMLDAPKYQILTEAFIHEGFHNTSANCREDHGKIQLVNPGDEGVGYCQDNRLDDRVTSMTILCMNTGYRGSTKKKAQELFERMNQCGMKRGCIDLWTSVEDGSSEVDSDPLSVDQAKSLCEKIYFEGSCFAMVNNPVGAVTVASMEPLASIAQEAQKKFDGYIPRFRHEIPPDLAKRVLSENSDFGYDPCLKAMFTKGPQGQLYLTPMAVSKSGISQAAISNRDAIMALSKSELQDELTASFEKASKEMQNCQGEKAKPLRRFLFNLRSAQFEIYNSTTFKAVGTRALYGIEKTEFDHLLTKNGLILRQGMAPHYFKTQLNKFDVQFEKVTGYHQALAAYHPHSDKFSCIRHPNASQVAPVKSFMELFQTGGPNLPLCLPDLIKIN